MHNVAIIEYPGTTLSQDLVSLVKKNKIDFSVVWHEVETLGNFDLVIVPDGNSFGSFLRPGAIAKTSSSAGALKRFAMDQKPIIGIGDGFSVLCEIALLEGAILRNKGLVDYSSKVNFIIEPNSSKFFSNIEIENKIFDANLSGTHCCFYADKRSLQDLEENGRVILRYSDSYGDINLETPLLGSHNAIGGICNSDGNVIGFLPNIECSEFGEMFFKDLLNNL